MFTFAPESVFTINQNRCSRCARISVHVRPEYARKIKQILQLHYESGLSRRIIAAKAYSEWSVERFLRWAGDIGDSTKQVVSTLLYKKRHPEQSYRSVLGLLDLAKKYDRQRLENACHRALDINSPTRTSVESILKKGLDKIPSRSTDETEKQTELALDDHENIRGDQYYH